MRRFHIYRGFIVWLLTSLFAVSCTDELEGNGYTPNSSSNLHVLVPTVLSANGDDFSGSSSKVPTYNATVDECQINDLRLYAFPVDGNDKLVAKNLPAPLASMMLDENIANYQLTIEPGKYHVYVVANMSDVLKDKNIITEDDLKNMVLGYTPNQTPGLPISTNIPMIYEPKDINGKTTETEIKATDKSATVIANLKFTCVKVKLNLIFDPAEATVFSGKSFSIKNILAQQLTPKTSLCWNGKFSQSEVSKEYAEGFESNQYDAANNKNGLYYPDGAWTRNNDNANINDKDVITLNEGAKGSANPTDATAKWLFQGTYYLPERYIADASQQSRLAIKGSIDGNIDNKYIIPLGHKQNESSTTELPTFPRGTYYEIIGNIKSLGNITLDCNVSVKDWTPVTIDADFNHTTLWVSKTKAEVTSTTNDYITYKSNAVTVDFGCDNKIDSKDIIIGTKRGKDANGNDSIEFRVNPNIPISDYANDQLKGTAKFWLKANNLKKYIDVHYDVTPYLDVTKELVIYYNKDDKSQNIRNIEWDTNLGGIKLEETKLTKGNSTIEMNLNSSDAVKATGVFTVTATSDPVTTTIHEFKVKPENETTVVKYKTVRVIVRPPVGDYRIYFRAINDRSKYSTDGKQTEDRFLGIKQEGGSNNWSDGWNQNSNDTDAPTPAFHHIYVYTQVGETTTDKDGKVQQPRCIYTLAENAPDKEDRGEWPGERMVADNTNTGWYYKDFAVDMNPKRKIVTEEDRKMKPGETLIMFTNGENVKDGYTKHRCPHHMAPGITLFDYEDHEGWIVYDPTSDPIWHMYDDMPEIENIAITIYTQERTWGWWKNYGIKGDGEFIIEDKTRGDTEADKKGNTWTLKDLGNGWWKTVINLKAIKGEHNKDIRINLKGTDILLFGGNSFKDDTGYYKNGTWHQGEPDEVKQNK